MAIRNFYYGKSPEEKVAIVEEENRGHRTAYFGDGINDAPAMAVANAGVAFGQRSDVTSEAAGAVIMDASLTSVDELLHIGRRMSRIAGGGDLPPVWAVILQEGIDVAGCA